MLSIITPTYNRSRELQRAYKSLLDQTSKSFEWIIIDDGSIDDTKKIVEKLKKENKIDINYISKENGGKPSAYNTGVIHSKNDLLLCLDSDDILTNDAVATILSDYDEIKDNDL